MCGRRLCAPSRRSGGSQLLLLLHARLADGGVEARRFVNAQFEIRGRWECQGGRWVGRRRHRSELLLESGRRRLGSLHPLRGGEHGLQWTVEVHPRESLAQSKSISKLPSSLTALAVAAAASMDSSTLSCWKTVEPAVESLRVKLNLKTAELTHCALTRRRRPRRRARAWRDPLPPVLLAALLDQLDQRALGDDGLPQLGVAAPLAEQRRHLELVFLRAPRGRALRRARRRRGASNRRCLSKMSMLCTERSSSRILSAAS